MARLILPISSLLLLHVTSVIDRPDWGLFVLFGGSVAGLAWVVVGKGPAMLVWVYGLTLAVLAVLISLTLFQSTRWTHAIYVPAVIVNLAISALFALSLLPGRVPLVTQLALLHHGGELPEPLIRYTRILTLIWALLLSAMAIEAGLLAYYVEIATWSWAINFVNPLILVAFFVGQFWYRSVRYHEYGKVSIALAVRGIFGKDES